MSHNQKPKQQMRDTYVPGPISDDVICRIFTKSGGGINTNTIRARFLDRFLEVNPHIAQYLEERYGTFDGYGETVKRIVHEKKTVPFVPPAPYDDPNTLTDEDIIRFFSDKRGKINPNKTREPYLSKYPAIMTYLERRYEKFFGYAQTLKCIFQGLDELPRCENCGKILPRADQRWCDTYCQLTDRAFIAERDANIDQEEKARKFRKTCQERYGVDAPAQNAEIMAKMLDGRDNEAARLKARKTTRQRYGVDNIFELPEIQERAAETRRRNRPSDPQNHAKQEQTMLERHGVKSALCKGELREKGRQTMMERYGTPYYNSAEASMKTKQERYGDPHYNNPDKHRETCEERYGVPSFSQTVDYAHHRTKTYLWHGIAFDSMPELAYFIYQTDQGHEVVCEPASIPYEYDGQTHIYIPDFSVDGELVEIKGAHFFAADGTMINPFGRDMDGLFEAKHQCMLANDVTIITDFREYIGYVSEHYGRDFLQRCRVPMTLSLDYLCYPQELTVGNINIAVKKAQWREFFKNEISRWETNNDSIRLRLYENRRQYLSKDACDLSHFEILRGLKIAGLVKGYSRFNPKALMRFIDEYEIASVYDPCAGWGERILTAYAKGIPYLGVDVNEALLPGYEALSEEYQMTEQNFVVADSSDYIPGGHYDAVFTCPPYFDQEIYSEAGAENLPHDEFLLWWRKVLENALRVTPRYVAFQANQKTKRELMAVMEDMGFILLEEFELSREASHFTHDTKTEYESFVIFAPPAPPV